MTSLSVTDEAAKKPVLTADGKPWVQRCYICHHSVNFLKENWGSQWIRVGEFVRHKNCRPEPLR